MRYSSTHKAQTRQRILDEASRRLRKDGIEGTGLLPLMRSLGLTHGGFYAHFASKDALVEASLATAADQLFARWRDPLDHERLRDFLATYLSPHHRDTPGDGCPLPTLAAELGLRGTPSPTADAMVARLARRLEPCAIDAREADRGLVALAALVGALTLARSVADAGMSARILQAVHAALTVSATDSAPACPACPATE